MPDYLLHVLVKAKDKHMLLHLADFLRQQVANTKEFLEEQATDLHNKINGVHQKDTDEDVEEGMDSPGRR